MSSIAVTDEAEKAPRVAVLAVSSWDLRERSARDERVQAGAAALRQVLRAQGAGDILPAEAIAARMRARHAALAASLEDIEARYASAEEALGRVDTGRAIRVLEELHQELARDPELNEAKAQWLERIRLRLATLAMALAGIDETGGATTRWGMRARESLEAALRARPALSLSTREYPPKLRRLLETARTGPTWEPKAALRVRSTSGEASVWLEGHDIGRTPLRLEAAIPMARVRLWLQDERGRSVVRWVDGTHGDVDLALDFSAERALWREGPGLRTDEREPIAEESLAALASWLAVEQLCLVHADEAPGQILLSAIRYTHATRSVVTEARVAMPLGGDLPAAAAALATALQQQRAQITPGLGWWKPQRAGADHARARGIAALSSGGAGDFAADDAARMGAAAGERDGWLALWGTMFAVAAGTGAYIWVAWQSRDAGLP